MTDPLLDRLLVALSARGHLRIGQVIDGLAERLDNTYLHVIGRLSDEDFVLALEEAVGDVDG